MFQQAELHHAAVLLDSKGWAIFLTRFVIYCSAKHRPLAEKRHDSATLKLVSEIIFALRGDKMSQRVIKIQQIIHGLASFVHLHWFEWRMLDQESSNAAEVLSGTASGTQDSVANFTCC